MSDICVGLAGTGCDEELDIIRETERAYLLQTGFGEEVWLPKTAFDETGQVTEWGYSLLISKLEGKKPKYD